MLHKRNVAMHPLIYLGLSLLMKNLVPSLMRSDVKIRFLVMRSKISWTKLAREEDPSTRLTKSGNVLRLSNLSSKLLLRRQKVLLNRRKTRFYELHLSLPKYDKKLSVALLKKKKSSLV